LGVYYYVDVLKSPLLLSLHLEKDNVNFVMALQHIFRSVKHIKVFAKSRPEEWPTVKLVLSKITSNEEANNVYQEQC